MAMTNQQQTDAYQFFVIAFGATPGVEYMSQLDEAYSFGLTTKEIVNIYTTKPAFTAKYPTFFTNEQFANALIANVVRNSASDAAKAEAKAKPKAKATKAKASASEAREGIDSVTRPSSRETRSENRRARAERRRVTETGGLPGRVRSTISCLLLPHSSKA